MCWCSSSTSLLLHCGHFARYYIIPTGSPSVCALASPEVCSRRRSRLSRCAVLSFRVYICVCAKCQQTHARMHAHAHACSARHTTFTTPQALGQANTDTQPNAPHDVETTKRMPQATKYVRPIDGEDIDKIILCCVNYYTANCRSLIDGWMVTTTHRHNGGIDFVVRTPRYRSVWSV